MIANKAAPSTNAAVRIMFARISLSDSGWRAIASTAPLPIWPIPIPAPIAARPAPIAPPALAIGPAANKTCITSIILLLYWFKKNLLRSSLHHHTLPGSLLHDDEPLLLPGQ